MSQKKFLLLNRINYTISHFFNIKYLGFMIQIKRNHKTEVNKYIEFIELNFTITKFLLKKSRGIKPLDYLV